MEDKLTFDKIGINLNLADDKVFNQFAFVVGLVEDNGSAGDSLRLFQELDHLIKTNQAKLGGKGEKYQKLLLELAFRCIPLLPGSEMRNILENQITSAYKNNIDLERSFSLIFVPYFVQDDFTKLDLIIRYLENNKESVGSDNIKLGEDKIVAPVISNWIKDYKFRTPEDRGSLNLATYITQSNNCKKLKPEEIDFLTYVFSFYDWLRFKASKVSFVSQEQPTAQPQIKPEAAEVLRKATAPKIRIVDEEPAPMPPAASAKPLTDFEKKLASVSVPSPAHGQDLEVLRQRMRLTEGRGERVEGRGPQMTPQEIKREVATKELPASPNSASLGGQTEVPSVLVRRAVVPVSAVPTMPVELKRPVALGLLQTLNNINSLDDLKKVSLGNLRQGEPRAQLQIIKTKIISLAVANRLLPYYTVNAFEQSPMFKDYLTHGRAGVEGVGEASDMVKSEFELIADFKKEIERL